MKSIKSILLIVCSTYSIYSFGQQAVNTAPQIETNDSKEKACSGCCCGNNQTPLGVVTDHIHPKGKWMASYTYMNMAMKGNRIGGTQASDNDVYKNYMMAPETMTMQMHMAMLMYGVTDKLTVMAMGGYSINKMSMNMSDAMMNMPGMVMTPGNMSMESTSSGFADTKVFALYNFSNKMTERIIGSLGINLPSGSIKATGTTMLGENQRLPYDMQLGTGSIGVLPDITYVRKYGLFSFGANAGANINLNDNSLGYEVGNMYHATAWISYLFLPFVSGSIRAEGVDQDKIKGSDAAIAIPIYESNDPTTNTNNYGGKWVNLYAGLNFHSNRRMLKDFNLLVEYGMPVYQDLNGTQMSLHANLLAGLQYSIN